LAALYCAQGAYAKAEPLYQRSLKTWEKALPNGHPNLVTGYRNYARLLRSLKRDKDAAEFDAKAQAMQAQFAAARK
jgi:tetratricopeptide (TPR) repeat protein